MKSTIKQTLLANGLNYTNDGSIFAQVNENIQWAWDNWESDIVATYYEGDKPERYNEDFMNDWIDNEEIN